MFKASVLLLFISLFFFNCSEESSNSIVATDDNTIPDDVFVKAIDTANVITYKADSTEINYMNNQVVVLIDTTVKTIDSVKSWVEMAGGEIVGQVPLFGFYQLEFKTTSKSELDSVKEILDSIGDFEASSYNFIASSRTAPAYCKRDDDNDNISYDGGRFAYEYIHYFTMLPIIGKAKELVTLDKVRVAVFDTGLYGGTGQFNNVKIIDLMNDSSDVTDSDNEDRHGTTVASVIAADDDDGGINGIASKALGSKLELGIINNGYSVSAITMNMFISAYVYDIKVVNMSFGYGGFEPLDEFSEARVLFDALFDLTPDVLYVAAAANEPFLLTSQNDVPAGMQKDNIITVGGLSKASPDIACSWSSYGPYIDIAAPCEDVPVIDPWSPGQVIITNGNSFATPMVTSLAAILLSVNPYLTPKQVKDYILEYCYPTDMNVGGRRLIMTIPVEQVLIDMGAPSTLLGFIDSDNDDSWDVPGVVEGRICASSKFSIEANGTHRFEHDSVQAAILNDIGSGFSFGNDKVNLLFSVNTPQFIRDTIELGEAALGNATYSNLETNEVGGSISGKFYIDEAKITEREGINDTPLTIIVSGTFSAVFEAMVDGNPVNRTGSGVLNLTLVSMASSPEIVAYLEENCIGGKTYQE